jgi:hypothetical protein
MWLLFIGFAASLAYGIGTAAVIYGIEGKANAERYIVDYIGPFNTLVTLGLITATTLIVWSAHNLIPDTIEEAFTKADLTSTEYLKNKQKYYSLRRAVLFASEMIVIGFFIFAFCHFPQPGLGEAFMLTAACGQLALASYVGRKLRYGAMMLHSLLNVNVTRNLFKERELNIINVGVNVASTLTVIWVYLYVRSYYTAPFQYDTFIGGSAQVFLLLPAVLAIPVLLFFNFFPREVLRKVYDRSIDLEVEKMQVTLKDTALTPLEKQLRLMELGKMYREELRYSLQLTLSDLPIGITIIVMVVEPFIGH